LKLSREKRKEIGKTISDQITSVSGSLSGLAERWDVNEAYYRNDMAIGTSDYDPQVSSDGLAVRLWNGQKWQRASVHTPLVQPICDSIADNIANIVLGQTNFCTAKANGGGSDKSNALTEEVQWHMSNAIIDSKIQKALNDLKTEENIALEVLNQKQADAERIVMLASISGVAEDVLATIPSVEALILEAAREREEKRVRAIEMAKLREATN